MKKDKKLIVGWILVGIGILCLLGLFSTNDFIALLFGSLIILLIGLVLILISIRKSDSATANQNSNVKPSTINIPSKNNTISKTAPSSATQNNTENIQESKRDYDLFHLYKDEQILKYKYEKEICFIEDDEPKIKYIVGNAKRKLKFIQESENEYDSNAVAIYLDNIKLGYVYKGQTQDMINDWYRKSLYFFGYINRYSVVDNKATYKIGFYKPIDSMQRYKCKLIKTSKKSEIEDRQENLSCVSEGDYVSFDYDYDDSGDKIFVVSSENGYEIGEMPIKSLEKINNTSGVGKIVALDENDSGKIIPTVEFYY